MPFTTTFSQLSSRAYGEFVSSATPLSVSYVVVGGGGTNNTGNFNFYAGGGAGGVQTGTTIPALGTPITVTIGAGSFTGGSTVFGSVTAAGSTDQLGTSGNGYSQGASYYAYGGGFYYVSTGGGGGALSNGGNGVYFSTTNGAGGTGYTETLTGTNILVGAGASGDSGVYYAPGGYQSAFYPGSHYGTYGYGGADNYGGGIGVVIISWPTASHPSLPSTTCTYTSGTNGANTYMILKSSGTITF